MPKSIFLMLAACQINYFAAGGSKLRIIRRHGRWRTCVYSRKLSSKVHKSQNWTPIPGLGCTPIGSEGLMNSQQILAIAALRVSVGEFLEMVERYIAQSKRGLFRTRQPHALALL